MHTRHLFSGLALGLFGMGALAAQTTQSPNVQTRPTATPPATAAQKGAQPGPSANPQGATAPRSGRTQVPPKAAGAISILVYDHNTVNNLAQTAANNLSGSVTVADSATFNGLLTGAPWDIVAVDVPSTLPVGGWIDLINHVNGGGRAVMAFWAWDDSFFGDPALPGAFDVSVATSISLVGQTLFDSGTSAVFAGVTMPNSDWNNNWSDDGDEFNPQGSALGLGHIGNPSTPVLVQGNAGRTIAAPVFDEAGGTWLGDGSAVRLWENMLNAALGNCVVPATTAVRAGLGLNVPSSIGPTPAGNLPTIGNATYAQFLDDPTASCGILPGTLTLLGVSTLPLSLSFGGSGCGIGPGEILIDVLLPTNPILVAGPVAWGGPGAPALHALPIPADPSLCGQDLSTQGVWLDVISPKVTFSEALDLTIGS